uniref:Disease resistance N-terminal domain-containing protein n=1 Tax=Arundo donax TaxID=35708 RepID=A0A0A9GPY9_ARUDO
MMAGLIMAGWFVNVCLSKLADPLIQYAKDRYKDEKDFGKNINKLTGLLDQVSATINYAEGRQLHDSKLQAWVWRLRDAVYSAEDVLDSIRYGVLREKVEGSLDLLML